MRKLTVRLTDDEAINFQALCDRCAVTQQGMLESLVTGIVFMEAQAGTGQWGDAIEQLVGTAREIDAKRRRRS